MKTAQQGLAGIIILIVIAVLLGGGYYLLKTGKLDSLNLPSVPGITTPKEFPPFTTLTGTEWVWTSSEYKDGTVTTAPRGKFVIKFEQEGRISSATDCNSLFGGYIVSENNLTITPFVGTKKFCSGSIEAEYRTELESATSFSVTENKVLRVTVTDKEGVMIFDRRLPAAN